MNKSELVRVGTPTFDNNTQKIEEKRIERCSYYTNIYFRVKGVKLKVIAKVDTGAAYTTIGFGCIDDFKDCIEEVKNNGKVMPNAYDATDEELDIREYVVSEMVLTDDIVLDKVAIYFSEKLKYRAVLGFDIFSLFKHIYELESGNLLGTYHLLEYERTMQRIQTSRENLGYHFPRGIMTVDEIRCDNE